MSAFWRALKRLNPGASAPWCCVGDFNELRSNLEKTSGRLRSLRSFVDFDDFVEECELVDLELKGPLFTWSDRQMGSAHIKERLDRVMSNLIWRELHAKALVFVLEPMGSDFSPLMLFFDHSNGYALRSFKFEMMWLENEGIKEVIERNWFNCDLACRLVKDCFINNLDRVRDALIKWCKIEFSNNRKTINSLMREFQSTVEGVWDEASGDKKCKFFHLSTIQRRQRNKVVRLKMEDDQ